MYKCEQWVLRKVPDGRNHSGALQMDIKSNAEMHIIHYPLKNCIRKVIRKF